MSPEKERDFALVLADALSAAADRLRAGPCSLSLNTNGPPGVDLESGAASPLGTDRSDKILITTQEAAARLSIGRSTLYELLQSGAVPSVRVGRRRLVPVDQLRQCIAEWIE